MKIVKIIISVIVIGAAYWFISDMISPYIRVSAYEPQKVYGETITFRVTLINFSPRPKEIPIGTADNTDLALLVDTKTLPKRTDKKDAQTVVSIPAFSNRTIERTVTLREAAEGKQPQVIPATVDVLSVSPGKHAVRATWGGHTSDEMTFGVR